MVTDLTIYMQQIPSWEANSHSVKKFPIWYETQRFIDFFYWEYIKIIPAVTPDMMSQLCINWIMLSSFPNSKQCLYWTLLLTSREILHFKNRITFIRPLFHDIYGHSFHIAQKKYTHTMLSEIILHRISWMYIKQMHHLYTLCT